MIKQLLNSAFLSSEELWKSRKVLSASGYVQLRRIKSSESSIILQMIRKPSSIVVKYLPYTRFIYTLYTPYIHPVYPLMYTLYTVYTLCTPVIYTLPTSYLTLYAAYLHGIYALYTPNIQLLYVL